MTSVTDYIKSEALKMEASTAKIQTLSDSLVSLKYATNSTNFKTEVYSLDKITQGIQAVSIKGQAFSDGFHKIESSKFSYEIATIIIIPVLAILGIVCNI